MVNEKASQRNRVIYEMGLLLQPIEECVKSDVPKKPSEFRIAIARTQVGDAAWRQSVVGLSTFPGNVVFKKENYEISHIPERLIRELGSLIEDPNLVNNLEDLKNRSLVVYENYVKMALKNIADIPVEWEPEIFPANTPFTAYCKIREAVVTCSKRLHYFDRYLKPEFFRLFVAEIPKNFEVRIITTGGNSNYGFKAVKDVSNLVRNEYTDYALVEVDPALMHDRNLRIDDTIFSLGPGVDRAGVAVTNFGPSDSSTIAHTELDQIISKGAVRHQS